MGTPAIDLQNISKSLSGRNILRDISMTVNQGDVFGFLGPNGAGKTTTIRILLGLYHADSGKASVVGKDVGEDAARETIGFMLDHDGLYDGMSAEANLAFYLRLYGKPVDYGHIKDVLGTVGLAERTKDKVGTFSKGMRQKASLARALVSNPEVLILDEPTSGLDPSAQMEFRELMLDIAKKHNKTVLLSSHNLEEVQKICNRIALLHKGEIKLYGCLEELRHRMGTDTLLVQVKDTVPDVVVQKLDSLKNIGFLHKDGNEIAFAPVADIKPTDIVSALIDVGFEVDGFQKREASLEEMYSSIVKEADAQ